MKRAPAMTILIAYAICAAQAIAAGITVPAGFESDVLLSPLSGGFVHQIEVVRNPAYGSGVVIAVAGRDGFKISRVDDGGTSTLAVIGPFPAGAELLTIRFDWAGAFGKKLLVSVFHNGGDQPFNYRTDIVMIEPGGTFATIASLGTKTSPMAMHFDVTDGAGSFVPGMYLVDGDAAAGAAVYHLAPNLTATLLTTNTLPGGRTDLDPRGLEFAPTGGFGWYLTLADSDHDDGIAAIYRWKADLTMGTLTTPAAIAVREFGDMAFSPGGALGDRLYVTDNRNKKVLAVSYSGQFADFASGFNNVQSISVDGEGAEMFVSDADGVYRIREHVIPPTTVAMGANVVAPGVGADMATGSRMVVGQSATGSVSNASTILHAGWIPSLFGAALAPMFADFDGNRIVDLDDYPDMNACFAGPEIDAGETCTRGDSNRDGDVDLEDASAFMRAFSESLP